MLQPSWQAWRVSKRRAEPKVLGRPFGSDVAPEAMKQRMMPT